MDITKYEEYEPAGYLLVKLSGKHHYVLNLSELELRQIKAALDELAMESCHDAGRILTELCVQFEEFFEKEKIEE